MAMSEICRRPITAWLAQLHRDVGSAIEAITKHSLPPVGLGELTARLDEAREAFRATVHILIAIRKNHCALTETPDTAHPMRLTDASIGRHTTHGRSHAA